MTMPAFFRRGRKGGAGWGEIAFQLGLVLFSAFFLWQTTNINEPPANLVVGPRTFPFIVGLIMLAVSVLLLWRTVRREKTGSPDGEEAGAAVPLEDDETSIGDPRGAWVVVAALIAMFVLLVPLGFVVAMTLFLFGLSTFYSPRHWLANAIVAIVFSVFFFFIFAWVLGIPLPRGILAPLLPGMVG